MILLVFHLHIMAAGQGLGNFIHFQLLLYTTQGNETLYPGGNWGKGT